MSFARKTIFNSDPVNGWLPWGALAPIIGLTLIVLATLPSELVLSSKQLMDEHGDLTSAYGFIFYLLTAFPLMALLLFIWVRFVEKRSLRSIGLMGQSPTPLFFKGQVIGIVSSGLIILSIVFLNGYTVGDWITESFNINNISLIAVLFVLFAIQSSIEEILFRGWLLSAITRKYNLFWGIVISSLLFTFLHFEPGDFWYLNAITFLFSLFACYLVLISNSVWLAMGWHAGWNWFIATGFGIPLTGIDVDISPLLVKLNDVGDPLITGGLGGPESSASCFVFFLLATLILHFVYKTKRKHQ